MSKGVPTVMAGLVKPGGALSAFFSATKAFDDTKKASGAESDSKRAPKVAETALFMHESHGTGFMKQIVTQPVKRLWSQTSDGGRAAGS